MSRIEVAAAAPPSPAYIDWLRCERFGRYAVIAGRLGVLIVFLALWEVLPRSHIVNPLLTSYPSALWPTFVALLHATPQQPGILAHAGATVFATIVGFALAMCLGTAAAAALWWWDGLHKVLDPYLVIANALPKTAFVPIFYLWLGPRLSVYGMALAISLFIAILMIYGGFRAVEANQIKLARSFGATRPQVFAKVVLPGSVPTLIAALKVNAGLSLVGVVVGEFQSANLGLGYLIQYGSQIFRLDIVMTAVTVLAIVSALMYAAIAWLEAAIMQRR